MVSVHRQRSQAIQGIAKFQIILTEDSEQLHTICKDTSLQENLVTRKYQTRVKHPGVRESETSSLLLLQQTMGERQWAYSDKVFFLNKKESLSLSC